MEFLADTSFLIYLLTSPSFAIDQLEDEFGGVEFVVTKSVIRELNMLKKKRRINIDAIKIKRVLAYDGNADDDLVKAAKREGIPVITMDKGLATRIRENGGRCILIHQGRPVQC